MILIKNATLINEGRIFKGGVLIKDEIIEDVFEQSQVPDSLFSEDCEVIDAEDHYLIPGLIDDQVHFREPGLTQKGNIASESKAALAGGITSYMEMPNTVPNTLTQALLEEKYALASHNSWTNYSFYMGVSNDNLEEVLKTDATSVCGIKIFMGSSTGNMLVDNTETLEKIFAKSKLLIATHCEDEGTIQRNLAYYKSLPNIHLDANYHSIIRSEEACYLSSAKAVELARKFDTRLHVLHISTEKELALFDSSIALKDKRITAEACIHHLYFSEKDYSAKGNWIKWNPAIKKESDREALWNSLQYGKIDIIATDHAPHTIEEKSKPYLEAPSGGPLVQHALIVMLAEFEKRNISWTLLVEKMCHNPAICFSIQKRGFLRKGYQADLVLFKKQIPTPVSKENILYHCAWSPFEGQAFNHQVTHTFINGLLVYHEGHFSDKKRSQRLSFKR